MIMSRSRQNLLVTFMAAFVMLLGFNVTGIVTHDSGEAHAVIKSGKIPDGDMQKSGEANKLMTKLMNVAKIFAGFVLAISVIMIVYGGLKYVLSQGDTKAAEQGKMLIIYAGIGIFIALSAFIIVKVFQGFA